jgi:hypothetical protein
MEQWYLNVPGVAKIIIKVPFFLKALDAVNALVSLVTVWAASLTLVQMTSVPALIVSVAGLKEYFSFFSTIFTMTIATGVGDVAGVGVGVGGAVVAVGVAVVA